MKNQFTRTALLLGENALNHLSHAHVAVFGIGGVGGYAAEALARSGIGTLTLVDHDTVTNSNINRQIIAMHSTIGKYKTDVMKERILDINPTAWVHSRTCFFLPENVHDFDFSQYDYIIDAVDTVTAKLELIECAQKAHVPIISSMGAGNKLDPTKFVVTDLYQTSVCPLAKVMRRECKKRGILSLKVVYSTEEARHPLPAETVEPSGRRSTPGSIAFVPSVAGLILAGEVIKNLVQSHNDGFAN